MHLGFGQLDAKIQRQQVEGFLSAGTLDLVRRADTLLRCIAIQSLKSRGFMYMLDICCRVPNSGARKLLFVLRLPESRSASLPFPPPTAQKDRTAKYKGDDPLVIKFLSRIRKLPQLLADHLLPYRHRQIIPPVVNHELDAYKVRDDGACSRAGVDGGIGFEGFGERGEGCEVWAWRWLAMVH